MTTAELQQVAEEAARQAGALLAGALQKDPGILSAEGRDIKTRADREAEAAVLARLGSTGIPILAEESGLHAPDSSRTVREHMEQDDALWIVDPLDGTYNYTRGIPLTCVSIGLWRRNAPALGVIYDFNTDGMWTGRPGEGACCNGEPVQVSDIAESEQGLLCTGFPSARDMGDEALLGMIHEVQSFKKTRMIGSAAMAMVFVARGWAEVYREESAWIWDIAAGAALVEAAGGEVRITRLQPNGQLDILATNGRIQIEENSPPGP